MATDKTYSVSVDFAASVFDAHDLVHYLGGQHRGVARCSAMTFGGQSLAASLTGPQRRLFNRWLKRRRDADPPPDWLDLLDVKLDRTGMAEGDDPRQRVLRRKRGRKRNPHYGLHSSCSDPRRCNCICGVCVKADLERLNKSSKGASPNG